MKLSRIVALLALLLAATPAAAQWQVKNHSVPIGRGAGVTGFGAVNPSATVGMPLVSTGLTLDPVYAPAQNAGIQAGVANTLKGTTDGVNTVDVAVPNCTAITSALRWIAGSGFNCGTITGATGFDMPVNAGLSFSTASTSLTLTLTQANGSAPTASNPVVVPLRSTSLTNGAVTLGSIANTISITIPSGATLGTSSSNVPFRIWIFIDANGGTPALGVATCSNPTTTFACSAWESTLQTSTAPVGNSAGTLYAAAGVSNDAVRIVGYCDYGSGLGTAGAWISGCTTLKVMGPGDKKPGDTVRELYATTGSVQTSSGATFPAVTGFSKAIVLSSTPNLVRSFAAVQGSAGVSGQTTMQLYRATGSFACTTAVGQLGTIGTNINAMMAFIGLDQPATLSSVTYGICFGVTTANGVATGGMLTLQEIMG